MVSGRYLDSQHLDSEIPRRYLDSQILDSLNVVRVSVSLLGLGLVMTVQILTGNHIWPSFGIIAMSVSRPIQSTEFVHRESCQSSTTPAHIRSLESLARDNSRVTWRAPPKACFVAF